MEKYGKIDILANVAGVVGTRGAFVDLDLADVQKTININLMGTINLSQLVAREMLKKRSGVIINVGLLMDLWQIPKLLDTMPAKAA